MLDAVPGGPHAVVPDLLGGHGEPADDGVERAVADRVEARLQARLGAGDDVVADCRLVEVAVPAVVGVGVRGAQGSRVRADGAVGEQVAGGADRAELAGPVDARDASSPQ